MRAVGNFTEMSANNETIKVIGAGFGRTGTLSLKKALETLGFGPCYHMFEVADKDHVETWIKAASDNNCENFDWETIFNPKPGSGVNGPVYHSTVDFPTTGYYKQILKQYPHAKVILTVRDQPEQWLASALETIASDRSMPWYKYPFPQMFAALVYGSSMKRFSQMVNLTIWDNPNVFNGEFATRAIERYVQWIEEAKSTIPPDQLLIMNVKEGWAPLCRFLGVPVPAEPFPRANDRQEFIERRKKQGWKALGVLSAGAAGVAALTAGALFAFKHLRPAPGSVRA